MMDKLYERVRELVAGQFFESVPLIDDLGYEITKIRQDGMIITVEGGRRFNITVVELAPRVG
jgi:hypothetical protein